MKKIILSLCALMLASGIAAQDIIQSDTLAASTDYPQIFAVVATDTVVPVSSKQLSTRKYLESQRKQQTGSQRFMPTRKRIDREIHKNKFAYKGEVMLGLTASYGTLSSDDSEILLIFDNINADATVANIKPFVGYFYRDNQAVGIRLGYSHIDGTLSTTFDLGASNDISYDIPYVHLKSNGYSISVFQRSYAALDEKGRFGLFAEFELGYAAGRSEFAYKTGGVLKDSYSNYQQVKLMFNPGAAAYIFPNVCATISFGLGGLQYTNVQQEDAEGHHTGSRQAAKMRFRLNLASINIGMTFHLWDKHKQ